MKKIMAFLLFSLFISIAAFSQSAEKISEIDAADKITYGQFCYLVSTATSSISDSASYEEAFAQVRKTAVFDSDIIAADFIPMSYIALLCSKTWNISESLMYKITKAPRYAFKQLQALEIISQTSDPSSFASGHQVLNIITKCIEFGEERQED